MKTPVVPPPWQEMLENLDIERMMRRVINNSDIKPTVDGRYRHWDSLRHLDPPEDLTHEEWWVGIKIARSQIAQPLPLRDLDGTPFTVSMPGVALQMLRQIDRDTSGQITISEHVTNRDTRRTFLVSSLMEEAIRSSQLEGASTSRRVAKEMIRSGREPQTKSEQMILNNYRAMNFVREHREDPLTPEMVLEVHRIVSEGPPPAEDLPARLEAFCDFANREDEGDDFVHPVVRSIVIHFWLGHDHPFEDGNGRTARALFYWSMLHRGYWLTEYLTISNILKNAPAKYARSFLYSEWDDNDLTYFLLYQLEVILRAIDGLKQYLKRKMREVRETEALLRDTDLNHRQMALLGHAMRTPGAVYTFRTHERSHNVSYRSARNDLLDLEERGLLEKRRVGRTYRFYPHRDLAEQLAGATLSPPGG